MSTTALKSDRKVDQDHRDALMLCSHWATGSTDHAAISRFAARLSSGEEAYEADAKIFRRAMARWERNAEFIYEISGIDAQFTSVREARDYRAKTLSGRGAIRWRQAWVKPT